MSTYQMAIDISINYVMVINNSTSEQGLSLIERAKMRASQFKSAAADEVLQIIKEAAGKQTPPAAKGPQPKI